MGVPVPNNFTNYKFYYIFEKSVLYVKHRSTEDVTQFLFACGLGQISDQGSPHREVTFELDIEGGKPPQDT